MSTRKKAALVTGGNKGIGFAIVEGLCRSFQGDVILASRDLQRGQAAVNQLQAKGLHPILHQLEISEETSLEAIKKFILDEYGGLDVLVNNAAIAFPTDWQQPSLDKSRETIRINYTATVATCRQLFPILRAGARVVNVSSGAGILSRIRGEEIKRRLSSPSLTEEDVDSMVEQYLQDVEEGIFIEKGWPKSAYGTSKVLLTAWTLLQQEKFDADTQRPDIVINATNPGFVNTDMTLGKGTQSIEEGAESSIFAALIAPHGEPRGKMIWNNCEVVDWVRDDI